jgi:hypothetical protein
VAYNVCDDPKRATQRTLSLSSNVAATPITYLNYARFCGLGVVPMQDVCLFTLPSGMPERLILLSLHAGLDVGGLKDKPNNAEKKHRPLNWQGNEMDYCSGNHCALLLEAKNTANHKRHS